MAVWGIGAYYEGSNPSDKTDEFISEGRAYIGWNEKEAPALYRMFDSVKVGDIIYIKAFIPRSKILSIKAVGIIMNVRKHTSDNLGTGVDVNWKTGFSTISINITPQIYKNNVFNNTLYEEFNVSIIKQLIDILMR